MSSDMRSIKAGSYISRLRFFSSSGEGVPFRFLPFVAGFAVRPDFINLFLCHDGAKLAVFSESTS